MSSHVLVLIAAVLVSTAGAAAAEPLSVPGDARASSHACAGDPVSPQPGGGLRVRDLSCAAARTSIKRGSLTVHGCPGRAGPCYSSFQTPRFHCLTPSPGIVRCTRGRRAFSFWWGE